jgi:hypothetical protein
VHADGRCDLKHIGIRIMSDPGHKCSVALVSVARAKEPWTDQPTGETCQLLNSADWPIGTAPTVKDIVEALLRACKGQETVEWVYFHELEPTHVYLTRATGTEAIESEARLGPPWHAYRGSEGRAQAGCSGVATPRYFDSGKDVRLGVTGSLHPRFHRALTRRPASLASWHQINLPAQWR